MGVSPLYTGLSVFSLFSFLYPLRRLCVHSSPTSHNCTYSTTYLSESSFISMIIFIMGNQSLSLMIDIWAPQNGALMNPDVSPSDSIQPHAPCDLYDNLSHDVVVCPMRRMPYPSRSLLGLSLIITLLMVIGFIFDNLSHI